MVVSGTLPAVVAYCDGGLGNRLNSLIGAVHFARRLGLPVTVSWPLNRWCAAPFTDLFDAPYAVDERSMPQIDAQLAGHVLLAHERQGFTMPVALDPRVLHSGRLVARLHSELARAGGVVYFNNTVPPYISRAEARAIARTLRVKPEYRLQAEEFLASAGLSGKPCWGLHLRGTDAGFPPRYYDFWFRVSQLLPGRIVLCTDDREVERRFLQNPAILRRETSALPRRATEGLGWNDAHKDEYGREFAYNICRDADAVRESMIDFEILARSRVLPTSRSTFLENAARFGDQAAPLARLQDVRAWLGYVYGLLRAR